MIKLSEGWVISVLAKEAIPVSVRLFLSLFWALKAAKVGLDFELYAGENEEEAEVETEEQKKKIEQSIDIVKQGIKKIADKPLDTIKGTSRELIKKIEEIPEETIQEAKSLLAKEEPQTNNKSLLEA